MWEHKPNWFSPKLLINYHNIFKIPSSFPICDTYFIMYFAEKMALPFLSVYNNTMQVYCQIVKY
jgi:hypothetical protein